MGNIYAKHENNVTQLRTSGGNDAFIMKKHCIDTLQLNYFFGYSQK